MKEKSEFEVAKKKKDRARRLKKLPVFLLVLAVCVCLYAMRYEIAGMGIGTVVKDTLAKMFDNKGYPAETEGTAEMITSLGSRVVLLSENGFEVFNEAGNKVMGEKKIMTEPLARSQDKKLLLFSQGGKDMSLYSGDVCLYEGETENPIYNATFSPCGFIAYSTSEFGYQSSVRVLDKNFSEFFIWLSADSIITNLSLDDDGNFLALFGTGFKEGEICTYGYIFDLNTGEQTAEFEFYGEMAVNSKYLPGGDVMLLTDKSVKVIEKDGAVSSDFSFKQQKLNAYCFNGNKGIAVSLGDFSSKRGNDLVIIDSEGNKILDTFVFEDIRLIDFNGSDIVIFSEDKYLLLDQNLAFKKKGLLPDALCAKVIDGYIYYTTENTLERIKL